MICIETKTILEDTQVDILLPIAQDLKQKPVIVASSEPLKGPAASVHVSMAPFSPSGTMLWTVVGEVCFLFTFHLM